MKKPWYQLLSSVWIMICCILLNGASYAVPNKEGIQVYQKNVAESPERTKSLRDDIDRYRNAEDLWDELRQGFTLNHEENNPKVQEQIQWWLNHQDYLIASARQAVPYLYFILQQVRLNQLPLELVLLPMLESSYNPFANSSAGAAGIWQMMTNTASGYGIKQNSWYDGRRDLVASTKAALNHLAYLKNFFDGNWTLALAAYDSGEGTVLSAIRKNVSDGKNAEYWSLSLPQETRVYVPRLYALAIIVSDTNKYQIHFPSVPNAPYLAQVDVGAQIKLTDAATLAGLSLKKLKQLNPAYSQAQTDPQGPFKLILPIENVEQFTINLAYSPLHERIDWTYYKIKSRDTLDTIAKNFDTPKEVIVKINPILADNSSLKTGSIILIPKTVPTVSNKVLESKQTYFQSDEVVTPPPSHVSDVLIVDKKSTETTDAKGPYHLQPGDTMYMVREGDHIEKIADRFHVKLKTLLAMNRIKQDSVLHTGQQLIIPTHAEKQISPGDTMYMVRRGDTLKTIAARYHTTPAAIRVENLLESTEIREGDGLVIPG